jgi:UDP-N-acetyl-D-mannosaminuronic acid dehydrogenase
VTDTTTAEMVKLMENTYRDINIAAANEFSRLGERFGVNIWEAIEIANLHPRVRILNPGPGVGGHCISVDPWFLVEAAPDLASLIYMSRMVNDAQPEFVVNLVKRALQGEVKGKKIAALGMTYKADVDDFRESPAVEVARRLRETGAQVTGYDPFYTQQEFEGIELTSKLDEATSAADVLLVLVAHKELKDLHPDVLSGRVKARLIVDTVNLIRTKDWQSAGFTVHKLGVGR